MIEAVPTVAAPGAAGQLLVVSASEVVREGLLGLLPDGWRERASCVESAAELPASPGGARATVLVDGDTDGAGATLQRAAALGGATILIVGRRAPGPDELAAADAVLARDEIEPFSLRLALAASRSGLRVTSRSLEFESAGEVPAGAGLSAPARQVLALLADGKRDAEIAQELHISESAVRKLVQRTVRSVGARTRAQAVAIVVRSDRLADA